MLVEQTYRGEQSYVVKDPESKKYYRFRPVEVMVMQALDGEHTPAEAAAALAESGLRVSAPGVEGFALKLKSMGLIERTLGERSVLLMERLRAQRRRRLSQPLFKGDIFRLRWSMGDPDHLLDRGYPLPEILLHPPIRPGFPGPLRDLLPGHGVEVGGVGPSHCEALTFDLTAGEFAVFWLAGTLVIVFHELAHGYTCKYFGGEVHEIGAMLFYFEPAFFCNVNDAWTFPELRARLWVTAAGSWIQMVLACLPP